MVLKNRQKSYIIIILLLLILFGLESLMLGDNALITKFFEFQVLVVYAYAQIQSIRKFGMFNLFSLILIGFFVFSLGGVLHYLISDDNILEVSGGGFGYFYFTNYEIQKTLLIYSVFISLAYLTYHLDYNSIPQFYLQNSQSILGYSETCFRLGKWLMWFFLVVELYKGYLFFTSFSADRALLFLYGNLESPIPRWVRFFATFFDMGYAFILCSIPKVNEFKKYSALYFISVLPDVLIGNRAFLGGFVLFVFWYYASFYNPKPFKTRNVAILGLLMFLLFQAMQNIRSDGEVGMMSYSILLFLQSQSISFFLLPLYMQYAGSMEYYSYPFVFDRLIGGFTGVTGQSIEALQHNCSVEHQLMYAINPDYYLSGASLGTSSITELYDLGICGIVLGAIFFPLMIVYFEKKFRNSRFALFLAFHLVTFFVLTARGSYFPSLYAIFKYYIFYSLLLFLYTKFVKKRLVA